MALHWKYWQRNVEVFLANIGSALANYKHPDIEILFRAYTIGPIFCLYKQYWPNIVCYYGSIIFVEKHTKRPYSLVIIFTCVLYGIHFIIQYIM